MSVLAYISDLGELMSRRITPVPRDDGPVAAFAGELRDLKDSALGSPTIDEICGSSGAARATLYRALQGKSLPGEATLVILVKAWKGNVQEWVKKRSKVLEQLDKAER